MRLFIPIILSSVAHAELSDSAAKQVAAIERDVAKVDISQPIVDPALMSYEAGREAEKLRYMIERNQGRLDKVPEAERAEARYVEAQTKLQAIDQKLTEWEDGKAEREAAKKKQAELVKAFGETRRAYDTSSVKLRYWLENTDSAASPESMLQDMDLWLLLDEMAEACSATHAEYLAGDPAEEDARRCDDAMNWRAKLAQAGTEIVGHSVARTVSFLEDDAKSLAETGEVHENTLAKVADPAAALAEYQGRWDVLYTTLEQPAPGDITAPLEAAIADVSSELAKAKGASRYQATGHADGGVQGTVHSALKGAGLTVVASSLAEPGWTDREGAYRIRTGDYLVKAPGEDFCRVYELTVRQDNVAGSWGPSSVDFDRATRGFAVSACK